MSSTLPPFHLAIPVDDIEAARTFYGEVLGFERGRSDPPGRLAT
jgi:extradiol dioxygenase family protein